MTESFQIVPAGLKPLWLVAPVAVLLLLAIAILGRAAVAANQARFELSAAGLRLRGDIYGRFIPARELRTEAAEQIDLRERPEFAPRSRTGGSSLPGYRAGWFRLRNGERALLYLTDPTRVVRIPTRSGYVVQLSVAEPERFLRALHDVRPPTANDDTRIRQ